MNYLRSEAPLGLATGVCASLSLAISSAALAVPQACDQAEANCQLPDIAGFPGGTILTTTARDNFEATASGNINTICWWGAYINTNNNIDCGPGLDLDVVTVTYYESTESIPPAVGDQIAQFEIPSATITKVATGEFFNLAGFDDPVAEYEWHAIHPSVAVTAGECYFMEITIDTGSPICVFFWEVSPSEAGDDAGRDGDNQATDYDMAWCINQALGDPFNCWLPVNPACEAAEGDCGSPNGSPGCEDPVCCTLVCDDPFVGDPFCCDGEWDQLCADIATGIIGCAVAPYNCNEPGPPNDCCTAPMVLTEPTSVAFDNTTATDDGSQTDCGQTRADLWYLVEAPMNGTLVVSTCNSATFDTTLSVYNVGDGVYDCQDVLDEVNVIACNDDGSDGFGGDACGGNTSEIHTPMEAGTNYLIRVGGFQGATGTGTLTVDFDERQWLWNTGPHRVVIFNGGLTNLGWSSGHLDDVQFPERRCAQAFTLDPTPGGTDWLITEIWVNGFDPGGVTNEFINWEVFTRTALDVAPGPADSVATGQVVTPTAFNDPEGGQVGVTWPIATDFTLPPGDYWLTMWASNAAGTASNLAWFTNANFGINNTSPPDPGACPIGDEVFMWRAAMYPDPGFQCYQTPAVEIDPDNPTDPNDLYNASFRIFGQPDGGGQVCEADLNGDDVVGPGDLAIVLGNWGPVPPGDPIADLNGDNVVGPADLAIILGNWGPCP